MQVKATPFRSAEEPGQNERLKRRKVVGSWRAAPLRPSCPTEFGAGDPLHPHLSDDLRQEDQLTPVDWRALFQERRHALSIVIGKPKFALDCTFFDEMIVPAVCCRSIDELFG